MEEIMKYIIKDWAGNILNYEGYFERFEFASPLFFIEIDDALDYQAEHLVLEETYVVDYMTDKPIV
jgi:hypothetical protein